MFAPLQTINDKDNILPHMYKGHRSPEVTDLEKANRQLAFKAAKEGIVLLRNEGDCLPLTGKRIALYGAGVTNASKGGTGSGEVNNRDNITIYQGFKNRGFTITTERWIADYKDALKQARQEFKSKLHQAMKGKSRFDENACYWAIDPIKESFPSGRKITEEDFKESSCDAAIYVITRQAGEGKDRYNEKGDYLLSDTEVHNIAFIANHYAKSILVINAGAAVDLSPLNGLPLKTVVFMGQAGEEGGNALAALLSGEANFSGKLTATWYESLTNHPLAQTYSYLAGQTDYEEYVEGIYVGYRYADAFDVKPLYPFGYGLSYTTFGLKSTMTVEGTTIKIETTVVNTGKVAGEEIVQAYLSFPKAEITRERKALVAFARTKEIKPGESDTIALSFDLADWGYYDEKKAAYFLDKGTYVVLVGDSSVHLTPVGAVSIDARVMTEKTVNVCPLKNDFEEIKAPDFEPYRFDGEPIVIDTKAFKTQTHEYGHKVDVPELIKLMSDDELAHFLNGFEAYNDEEAPHVAPGCAGKTAPYPSVKYNIPVLAMADGPAGLRLVPVYHTDGESRAAGILHSEKLALGSKFFAFKRLFQGISLKPKMYAYATAFPVGIVLAQTFDTELLEEIGRAVSKEMDEYAIDIWLAPGMNIMRYPLCGRNFEYFSEDPLLSGKMASAISRGVAESGNHTVTLKHYCCNNQEDNRLKSDSRVHERALREIYLKGFKIAVKEGKSAALMTSYNLVNGVYTNSSFGLIATLLRDEWGFDGLVMSDWGSVATGQAVAYEAIKAGNDIIMPGGTVQAEELVKSLKNGELTRDEANQCGARILSLTQKLRS